MRLKPAPLFFFFHELKLVAMKESRLSSLPTNGSICVFENNNLDELY
jgi:hypothetical protein